MLLMTMINYQTNRTKEISSILEKKLEIVGHLR